MSTGLLVVERKQFKKIMALLNEAPNEAIRFELVELLFTPAELVQLQARYEIVEQLIKGQKTQRDLASDLKLSIAKITRGSNELKRRSSALKSYLGVFFS